MGKEEIRKSLDDSRKILDQNYENFANSIKDNLKSFKKKTLDRI